jgi:hypothetical protein
MPEADYQDYYNFLTISINYAPDLVTELFQRIKSLMNNAVGRVFCTRRTDSSIAIAN